MSVSAKVAAHEHQHAPNRFAVIPTHVRLNTIEDYTGKGVTIAFLDSGFYPHPDLTEPTSRIVAFKDITGQEASLDLFTSASATGRASNSTYSL